ncbi:MAG: porin family protein [Cytophagales bacterium]
MKFYSNPALYISFLFSVSVSNAQILLGAKLGLSNATATVDTRNIPYTLTESLNRFQFGLVYDHNFHNHLSIRTEFLYAEKGHGVTKYFDAKQFEARSLQNRSSWEYQTTYLELPIMLKWFTDGKKFKFYVNGGIYGAYWLSAKFKGSFFTTNLGDIYYSRKETNENYTFDNDLSVDKRKDNRFDFGLVAGVGVAYKISKGEFFIEGRYAHGLADRFAFEQSPPKYYQPQMNRVWNISAGFLFTLKPKKIKEKKIKTENNEEEEQPEEDTN